VTTIDTAAAWRVVRPFTFAVSAILIGFGLAGCETGSNLFGANTDSTAPTALTQTAPIGKTSGAAKFAIAPVIGAPDAVASQLTTQLATQMQSKNVAVATDTSVPTPYTLRGYIVSAKEPVGTKVSYIWDVTDTTGKRLNRITGEKLVQNATGTDPWAAVTPNVVNEIASKTANSLATWLPSQAPTAAGATPTPAVAAYKAPATNPAPAATPIATAPVTGPTTGSIYKTGKVMAMVPSVTGAPGDGSVSLTNALQRQLTSKGVALATNPTPSAYRVEGRVAVGANKAGKQPIQIDWDVKDPTGKKLGTVSQKNEIPQGSLDGAWGKTADAAAAAAAQGILKLLPRQN
jgi:uncharacterized lipoprotein YmbA